MVGVKTDDGILTARKIILASGGFGASAELLSKYIPKAVGIPFPGHHGSTGDGIKMGLEIGAAVENMGAFQPYPAYIGPGKRAVPPEVALSGGIMVDAAGKRFVDETRYPGGLGIKMLDLPGKQAYEIFDERIFQLHRDAPGLRSLAGLFDAGLLLTGRNGGGACRQTGNRRRGAEANHPRLQRALGERRQETLSGAFCRSLRGPLLWNQSDGGAVPHPGRLESERGWPGHSRRWVHHPQPLRRRRCGRRCLRQRTGRLFAGKRVIGFSRFRHDSGGPCSSFIEGVSAFNED